MATKTDEDAGTGAPGTEAQAQGDETAAVAAKDPEEGAAPADAGHEDAAGQEALEQEALEEEALEDADEEQEPAQEKVPSGVGQGAGAVVSAALGLVSLSGGWIGTVAGARQQLIGQLHTSSTAAVAKQIKAVYGDAWHSTALWAGLFALAALLTGVVVLARPAFGVPGRPQAPWIKSVAWAGISLGVIGLLLAVLKYSDALLGLPSAS
ncbi:hypothetical protein A6P39_014500 [Streptomyces sp. FXJ1.172]|uniref:hypothetical protein n=1 Tax=Streptomyces sp. FXJ1.172 TaxID=710705 RepID=UPI0007CF10D6|nr:hypothetical protein [Streptomyces sp. FXJ1.172]WEO95130.1 hypothetical protein A6P39_014500 [Streptomyces sp. FXJ1.172]